MSDFALIDKLGDSMNANEPRLIPLIFRYRHLCVFCETPLKGCNFLCLVAMFAETCLPVCRCLTR